MLPHDDSFDPGEGAIFHVTDKTIVHVHMFIHVPPGLAGFGTGLGGDVLAMMMREPTDPPDRWTCVWRFRYRVDNLIWGSQDEKSAHRMHPTGPADLVAAKFLTAFELMVERMNAQGDADGPVEIEIAGPFIGSPELMEYLKAQPWCSAIESNPN